MIEAMACGTPVIAYDGGAVSEVINEGQTGFIAKNLEDAAEAVHRVPELSRAHCRKVFEKRFTVTRMARDYVKIYKRTIDRRISGLDRCIESSRREITACRPAFENSKIKDCTASGVFFLGPVLTNALRQ
jgi:Glycosyl transferases group 1